MAGLSKRIATVPKDLVIGETWILLAHKKAIIVYTDDLGKALKEVEYKAGVFAAFRPTGIEYVVTGKETEEELDALEKRGITLVDVKPDIESQIPLDKQLDDYEVVYYEKGDRNKKTKTVKAHSENAARQNFKRSMGETKTNIRSITLLSIAS